MLKKIFADNFRNVNNLIDSVSSKVEQHIALLQETLKELSSAIQNNPKDLILRQQLKVLNTAIKYPADLIKGIKSLQAIRREQLEAQQTNGITLAVYGSARDAFDNPDYEHSILLGKIIARYKQFVITGGAFGVMEAVIWGVYVENNKSFFGNNVIIPGKQETPNEILAAHEDQYYIYQNFATRKTGFSFLMNGEVTCPGGPGTIDEDAEDITLKQVKEMAPWPHYYYDRGQVSEENLITEFGVRGTIIFNECRNLRLLDKKGYICSKYYSRIHGISTENIIWPAGLSDSEKRKLMKIFDKQRGVFWDDYIAHFRDRVLPSGRMSDFDIHFFKVTSSPYEIAQNIALFSYAFKGMYRDKSDSFYFYFDREIPEEILAKTAENYNFKLKLKQNSGDIYYQDLFFYYHFEGNIDDRDIFNWRNCQRAIFFISEQLAKNNGLQLPLEIITNTTDYVKAAPGVV